MSGASRVGVSGTRYVLTQSQRRVIRERLAKLPPGTVVIVGGCSGADAYVARAVFAYCPELRVHAIVPADERTADWVDQDWRVWCHTHEMMPAGTTNRDRNARLINSGIALLLAWPAQAEDHPDSRRSGTWQTIRMARKLGIPVEVEILAHVGV